ncbi:MAG: glycosyl transferase family 2 [Myxococcales bacterium]|nr:glycosyl transferase family 2 [Myxococcales bacterium]
MISATSSASSSEAVGPAHLYSVPARIEDPEIQLLVPAMDVVRPEISVVIPALNEELTISDFVDWCHEGFAKAGIVGEVLIIDSGSDRTSEIALAKGARVLKTPRRGLGRAYIDALPYIRAEYVLMGDADCTYDFREIGEFVEKFRAGDEFVMGSRYRGYIEPGSMPKLHRYLGTPVTTWILNFLYSSKFSDIHCGMRGITREALGRLHLESQSWEYASEMVLKSVHLKLKTTEVPVRFLKDRDGRLSHHKRSGWFSPWHAAWINLRAMFVYGADFFVLKPGFLLLVLGLVLTLPLTFGPVKVGAVTFSLYWMLAGLTATLMGLQGVYLGCLARVFYDFTGSSRRRLLAIFSYTRTALISGVMLVAGLGLTLPLIISYVHHGLALPAGFVVESYQAVTGLMLIIGGFSTFVFTLLLHAAAKLADRTYGRPQ